MRADTHRCAPVHGLLEALSEETDEIGYHRSKQVIGKLNTGGRDLRVAEFLVFAAALDVPPALLLFGGYPDGMVEYLPGRECTSKQAVEWFSGAGHLPTGPDGAPTPGNVGTDLVAAAAHQSEVTAKCLDLAAIVRAGDEQLRTELTELSMRINAFKSILEVETSRQVTN